MENKVELDFSNLNDAVTMEEIKNLYPMIESAHNMIHNSDGKYGDSLGWVKLPCNYDKEEFLRIKTAAEKIRNDSQILLVIGIGGSYLGSRAVIESLRGNFFNNLPDDVRGVPAVYFVGNNLSSSYIFQLMKIIEHKSFSINVISKSGTTTEPAIAFRAFKRILEERCGREEAEKRIYVTTDKSKGALKQMANQEGYESFVIPDSVGGRFSVLTAVGLLPIAVAGIDIDEFMAGADEGRVVYSEKDISQNPCYLYAAIRHLLYEKGKTTEILVNYEPSLEYMGEWFKQLFAESHGKSGKGIFPASVNFSTDLHSMGQYIQDGMRNIFETVINIEEAPVEMVIESEKDDVDNLNYISGRTLDFVNKCAMHSTMMAHVEGNVPNILINVKDLSPYSMGQLIYFFEKACAIGGCLLGINPFDQPGVEAYKNNMFAFLGKPGYEEPGEILRKKRERV